MGGRDHQQWVDPLAMDPKLWLNMVNVIFLFFLLDLDIDSMKRYVDLEYKRYYHMCPRQLLRSMQQFVLEEHLDILCSEDEIELEELME